MPARVDRIVVIGLLMIAAQLAYRWWALSGSWFYFDDLAFISRAQNQPLDASYLFESYGGHLMPGAFWVIWWLTHWFPFEWTAWALVLIGLQALASVGMLRLLLSCFGHRKAILALLAGYLAMASTLPAFIWFAAGINQLPLQVALVFGLHAHLGYLRTRRTRHLLVTLGWTAFGLLFYEKTLILFGIYAIVAAAWFSTGSVLERVKDVWTRYRTGVLAHGAMAVGYLVLYVELGLNFDAENASSTPWTPVVYNLVAVAFATAAIGGPFQWQTATVGSIADPSQLVMLASWVALGLLFWHARRTRTRSQRGWLLIGYALALNVGLVVTARAFIVGPDIALEYRYQSESSALLAISAGLALLPLLGARETNEIRADAPVGLETPRNLTVVTVALTLAAVISASRFVEVWWAQNPTPEFFANLESSLAEASSTPVPMVDVGLPQTLLWSFRYPENSYSHVLRPYSDQIEYVTSSVDHLYMLNEVGQLAPVLVTPVRSAVPAPDPSCAYPLGGTPVDIPLDGPVVGDGWWIRLGYHSEEAVDVEITAGTQVHELTLEPGLHNAFVTAEGEFDTVRVERTSGPHPRVCLNELVLGLPEPAEGAAR